MLACSSFRTAYLNFKLYVVRYCKTTFDYTRSKDLTVCELWNGCSGPTHTVQYIE